MNGKGKVEESESGTRLTNSRSSILTVVLWIKVVAMVDAIP